MEWSLTPPLAVLGRVRKEIDVTEQHDHRCEACGQVDLVDVTAMGDQQRTFLETAECMNWVCWKGPALIAYQGVGEPR